MHALACLCIKNLERIRARLYFGPVTILPLLGGLAIRRIFSLVNMITNTKFSNCPNDFKIGVFRQ